MVYQIQKKMINTMIYYFIPRFQRSLQNSSATFLKFIFWTWLNNLSCHREKKIILVHNDLFYKLKHKFLRLHTNVVKAEIVGNVFESTAMNLQSEKKREKETWRIQLITPEPTDPDAPLLTIAAVQI